MTADATEFLAKQDQEGNKTMCDFFSFVTFNGKAYYFNASQRRHQDDPDSHSVICDHYHLSCDKVNKYEFRITSGFRIDQINAKRDDSRWAKAWIAKFSKSKEFSDICVRMLKYYPQAIRFILNPTEAQKLRAVNENGYLIEFIKNPSEAICRAAIKKSCWSIENIKNPSERTKLFAVSISGTTIGLINNPSEKVQLVAVKAYPYSITEISRPTKKVQLAAIKADYRLIGYIRKPCKEAKELAAKLEALAQG